MEKGRGIAQPLSTARYFTPMVINMVAIGEESGSLDDMLKMVAEHYDDEVAYAVKGLSDALGPVLIVGLAGVVGFFALAIFLPMWDLTKIGSEMIAWLFSETCFLCAPYLANGFLGSCLMLRCSRAAAKVLKCTEA